ncbi:MAG TPA: hypothetical protein VM223_17660 [Planctomycetota bacterium]|nr:hypothetical protein [Planctomycetota bacterium]
MKSEKQSVGEESGQRRPERRRRALSPTRYLIRFVASWFGFAGLYSAFAACPFCGRQGCPVGLVSAASVGAFFALCIQDWKCLIAFVRRKLHGNEKS